MPNKHDVSHELKQKIKQADYLELACLYVALCEYYQIDQNLLDELLPQAHQLEHLIDKRLDQLHTY